MRSWWKNHKDFLNFKKIHLLHGLQLLGSKMMVFLYIFIHKRKEGKIMIYTNVIKNSKIQIVEK